MGIFAARCEHGVIVAAATQDAGEDSLREMAACYALELKESVAFDGECQPCRERYLKNCLLLEIEP